MEGISPRLEKLAKSHPLLKMRVGVLTGMVYGKVPASYDVAAPFAKDPEPEVRKAVLSALLWGTPADKNGELCTRLVDAMKDEQDDVAANATHMVIVPRKTGDCKAHFDAVLDRLDARATAGTVQHFLWSQTLGDMFGHASPAQRTRALVIARRFAEPATNSTAVRNHALNVIWAHDPAAKAFLKKFENDKDTYVAVEATKLGKEPPPKPE